MATNSGTLEDFVPPPAHPPPPNNASVTPPNAPVATTPPVTAAHSEAEPGCGENEILDTVMGYEEDHHTHAHAHASHNKRSQLSLPKKKSGIFGASSNLVNSIVGAGIIGMPYALRNSGLVAGVLLLLLVSVLTDKSLRMIVEMASFHPQLKRHHVMTYEDLASFCFGRVGSGFVLFNMFVLAYGAMVAYLLIIKDTVPTIINLDNGIERELVLIVTSLLIVVPLSMQRDMASLAFTSLLSITADAVLVVFIAAYSPIKSTVSSAGGFGQVLKDNWINGTIFIGLGILSTAMACQHSAFIVSGSLANKTRARWAAVTYRALFVSTLLCAVLGICGYLGFLDETKGNVLNNFDPDSTVANAARALLAVTMFFTYPMESFVARHVLIKLIHNGDMDGEHAEQEALDTEEGRGEASRRWYWMPRRHMWTLAIYVAALVPALIVNDLGPVLSITGSLGGSCISYMAPGIIYLGVHGEEFLAMTARWMQKKRSKDEATGDIELPVAGDSTQVMHTSPAPAYPEGSKPFWWFFLLMPIWCSIASSGSMTLKENLRQAQAHEEQLQQQQAPPPQEANIQVNVTEEPGTAVDEEDDVVAKRWDFGVAIFMIVFGVVGAVAGIGSNIYVQVNDVFYSPS